jgi:hypothetical protein
MGIADIGAPLSAAHIDVECFVATHLLDADIQRLICIFSARRLCVIAI